MKGLYDYSEETASDMAARLKANEVFFLFIFFGPNFSSLRLKTQLQYSPILALLCTP